MHVVNTIEMVRQLVANARANGKKIGLVPTMGALHQGHISLIERAVADCDFVVVSIFVNPTQFAPDEDFDKYPRDIDADSAICKKAGADLIFAPSVSEMYPQENITWVDVEKITERLCGKFRQGHFRGVTTVCAKLFNIVCPDAAFFGRKDAQQSIVIKRMVSDLNIPLEIVVCPTVRQEDGLALSSRNKYLTTPQRNDALLINKALNHCHEQILGGQRDCRILIEQMNEILTGGDIELEYLSIVDSETLNDIVAIESNALVAIAAYVGQTRLIDNFIVDLNNR